MSKGTYRRVIAASMLAICLVLAVPQTAEARLMEPSHRDQIESLERELAFWDRIKQILLSVWAMPSVFIVPD